MIETLLLPLTLPDFYISNRKGLPSPSPVQIVKQKPLSPSIHRHIPYLLRLILVYTLPSPLPHIIHRCHIYPLKSPSDYITFERASCHLPHLLIEPSCISTLSQTPYPIMSSTSLIKPLPFNHQLNIVYAESS